MLGNRRFLLLIVVCMMWTTMAWAVSTLMVNGRVIRDPERITGTVSLSPAQIMVGVPCELVMKLEEKLPVEPNSLQIGIQTVDGREIKGVEYLADRLAPYKDGTYRMPLRFTEPCQDQWRIVVAGEWNLGLGGGFFATSGYRFSGLLPTLKLDVRELPATGRPATFSGAVGTKYLMTQKLEPDHVHPGDLVTATYELTYEGYCPTNMWPCIEHLSKEFKAYEPKEVERTANSFKWTQVLVPRTTAATNSPLVSLSYFNPRLRRYEVARAYPRKLVFVSDKAASTQNTAVLVNAEEAPAASASGNGSQGEAVALVLRFAPSDRSPVIATLPPGTSVQELSRVNGWRRLKTSRAIGWSR